MEIIHDNSGIHGLNVFVEHNILRLHIDNSFYENTLIYTHIYIHIHI